MSGPAPRRVRVVGNSGSGKTTFGRALAQRLGVPHVELDAVLWDAGWQWRDLDEARALVAESRMSDTNGWAILLQDRIALGQQESAQLRPQPPTETVQISHEVEQSL